MEPRSEAGEVVKEKANVTLISRHEPIRSNSIMAIAWWKLITQVVEEVAKIRRHSDIPTRPAEVGTWKKT